MNYPLSTLDGMVGMDRREARDEWSNQTRIHAASSVHRIATEAGVEIVEPEPVTPRIRQVKTFHTQRRRAVHGITWPIFLCGFIAGIFGGVAFVKSPAGKKPVVQQVLKQTNAVINHAVR